MLFSACYHEAIIINCNHIFNEKTLSISELILLNLLSFHHCQMIASKMKWEQLRPFRNHIVFYHIFYNIPARILQYLKIFDLFLFMKPNIFLQWFQKVDKQTSWVWCVHPFEYSNDWFHTQHIQITIFLYKYWSYSYICWRTLKLCRRLCERERANQMLHIYVCATKSNRSFGARFSSILPVVTSSLTMRWRIDAEFLVILDCFNEVQLFILLGLFDSLTKDVNNVCWMKCRWLLVLWRNFWFLFDLDEMNHGSVNICHLWRSVTCRLLKGGIFKLLPFIRNTNTFKAFGSLVPLAKILNRSLLRKTYISTHSSLCSK